MFLLIAGVNLAVKSAPSVSSFRLGDDSGDEISKFMQALNHKDPKVRAQAADALGEIGPDAIDAIPKLIKVFLRDIDARVRAEAADALELIGLNDEVNRALLEASSLDSNRNFRGAIGVLLDKVNLFLH